MILDKLNKLEEYIRNLKSCVVAFSGGVDSTFLLYIANRVLDENVIAVTINAPVHSKREINEAIEFAKELDVNHKILEIEDIDIKEFKENISERCYHCKKEIFKNIKHLAFENGIKNVLDGTNIDDLSDYRPGIKALAEMNILSPLKEVGLTKDDIRVLSKKFNIPTWDKPSFACLASRIPYGQIITREKLYMIEEAENYLQDLGFKQFRVRHHGEIARIEIEKSQMDKILDTCIMDDIQKKVSSLGFKYVTLDLCGYRSGSLNEVLENL